MVAGTKTAQKKAAGKERMRSARDTSVAAVGARRPATRIVSPLGAAAHEATLNGAVVPALVPAVVPAVAKARRKTAAPDDIAATGLNGAARKTTKAAKSV